jgi:hypothetical protein
MTRLTGIPMAAALLMGCATMPSERDIAQDFHLADRVIGAEGPLTITVDNQRPMHMRIYALNGGARIYVGEVRARQSGMFRVSRTMLDPRSEFRLVADPVGSTADLQSDLIAAVHDRNVDWLLRRGGGDRIRVY